jgi:hypothetical protein
MREFVSAGGELIIHGALQLINSPIPDLAIALLLRVINLILTSLFLFAKGSFDPL